jgi:hypothetical protein
MFHKKDLLILALFCLIAVAVAAAAYVVINGPSPLLTASATQPPAAPQTPVPTVASTGPSPSPLTETPTALPTFTPALVPQFGPVTFGVGVRGDDGGICLVELPRHARGNPLPSVLASQ